jgi:phenylacetic acid degradation operon negative regulatory protein
MGKLLTLQDKILMGLALVGDVWEEAKDAGGLLSYSYKLTYGWVPPRFKKHDFYQAVKRLLKTGTVERIHRGGKPYLRLTNQGRRKISRDFPLFEIAKKKWDKKWTVVIFDIKEIIRWIRDIFRNQIIHLGCGKLQRSVYITPHDITQDLNEMIAFQGLRGIIRVFRAPLLFEEDEKELANRVWKLEKLNEEYQKIIDEWEENKGKLQGKKRQKLIRGLKTFYLNILSTDPILPKDLLPHNWVGERACQLIRRLK